METYGLASLRERPAPQRKWRHVYERVCTECGEPFVTPYSTKIRCSWPCQEAAQQNALVLKLAPRKARP